MSESFLIATAVRNIDVLSSGPSARGVFQHPVATQGHGSKAMQALVSAFSDVVNGLDSSACACSTAASALSGAAPPLGSILALVKETGKSRKECKAALMAHANDCDAARWALLQPAAADLPSVGCEDGGCSSAVPMPGFEPADRFVGGRSGWVYHLGPHGLGYYPDPALPLRLSTGAHRIPPPGTSGYSL